MTHPTPQNQPNSNTPRNYSAPPAYAPTIKPNVGRPVDSLAVYTKCEHTHTYTDGIPNHAQTTVRCADPAIIAPGYYRSCARHIIPLLIRSLDEFTKRPAAVHDDPQLTEHIHNMIQELEQIPT